MRDSGHHIAVIAAEPAQRASLTALLESAGFPVHVFPDAEEAFAALSSTPSGFKQLEERYRMVFERMMDGFALHEMILDEWGNAADYRFVAVNPAFEQMTGIRAEAVVGKTVLEVLPTTERHWIETFGGVVQSGKPVLFENFHEGLGKHFEVLAFRPQDGHFAVIFRDITERKNREAEIARLTHLYAVLSQVNQVIVRAQSREELFESICRVAVEFGEFRLVWIGILAPEAGTVRLVAQQCDAQGFAEPVCAGECAIVQRAMSTGRPYVCNVLQPSQSTAHCHMVAMQPKSNIGSCAAFPFFTHGEACGAICLHAVEPDFFNPAEVNLLEEVAQDVSFALEKLAEEERRKEFEEALRRSETLYRTLFESANDGVFLHHVSLNSSSCSFVAVNPLFCAWLGYSQSELLKMSPVAVIDPESLAAVRAAAERLFAEGRVTFELTLKAKDGRRIPVEHSSRLVQLAGENLTLTISRDMTERKRAESALLESEERYRRHYQQSPLGYQSLDADGRVIDVNPAWLESLGYERSEVIGHWFGEFLEPAEREGFNARFDVFKETGRTHAEYRMMRKDGSTVIMEIDGKLGYDAAGRVQQTHCILHNVTERRQAEEEKARLEKQLLQSQKLESIGRLAGGIAHDFNNLLTVINGHTELLLTRLGSNDPLSGSLSEIRKAGERAASLTRQLLAFSRRQVVEPRTLDLNDLIRDIEAMLRRLAGEDIELIVALDPALGSVTADQGQIHQVLLNLVVNARDAMPGGGRLSIRTKNAEGGRALPGALRPGPYVELEVSDSGTGMDEEVRQHIFEPFFTTKEEGSGTGLGLATVYGIVRQSGGWIDVRSEPGRGSAFTVYLPRVEATAGKDDSARTELAAVGGKETILLVEDHAEVRALARVSLELYGYHVLEAESGEAALRLIESHPTAVHLLLTDLVLPNMTGVQLARRVLMLRPELPVVYMSGYTESAIVRRGIFEPGMDCLMKPFTPAELAGKIRTVLGPPLG